MRTVLSIRITAVVKTFLPLMGSISAQDGGAVSTASDRKSSFGSSGVWLKLQATEQGVFLLLMNATSQHRELGMAWFIVKRNFLDGITAREYERGVSQENGTCPILP